MTQKSNVWLVLAASVLAIGGVYTLSVTSPQPSATAEVTSSKAASNAPAAISGSEIALSPDLTKTDPYEFLDPIPVGNKAPDFSAKAADGKPFKLSDFKGKKNVVITFYQGSFCSVCGAQLTNLQKHLSDYKKQDAEIIAVSADDNIHAMQTVGEHGLSYRVVPDASKKIIKQFGVSNISKRGLAWPSIYVIDKKGIVKLSYASPEGHRLHSSEILPVLSKITGKPAPKLQYED